MILDDILEKIIEEQEEYENPVDTSAETGASVAEMPRPAQWTDTAAA